MEEEDGSFTQEAVSEIQNMDFCVSGPVYGPAKQGALLLSFSLFMLIVSYRIAKLLLLNHVIMIILTSDI